MSKARRPTTTQTEVLRTFVVELNDSYLAIERVAQLFRHRQVKVEYLTLAKRSITIVAHVDGQAARRMELSLWKLVNVVSVQVSENAEGETGKS